MIYALGIPLMALAAILQSAVVNHFNLLNGRPDLVLLLLLCIAIFYRIRPAMVLAFWGGLFLDLFSGFPLGVASIQLVLVMYVLSFTENRFWQTNLLVVEIITLAASIMFHFSTAGIGFLTGSSISFSDAITRIILPSTLLNLVFVLPLAYLSYRLRERFEYAEEEELAP